MTRYRSPEQGFTAVELIIALVVGVLLLGSAYQLYTTVVTDAGDAQRQSQASNAAYALLRQYQNDASYVGDPCSAASSTPAVPTDANLPGATATVATTCPFANADLNLITVTVRYKNANSEGEVSRAIIIKAS